MNKKIIALSGANGFIGKNLNLLLIKNNYEVWPLVRVQKNNPKEIFYDYEKNLIEHEKLAQCYGVIHLAGENLFNNFWSSDFKKKLRNSRIKSTLLITKALADLPNSTLKCFISASAVGIYGDKGEEKLTENSSMGNGFLATLCADWENATNEVKECGIRTINTRIGLVLHEDNGLLKKLIPLFKLNLGAVLGDGKQYMSFISIDDLTKAFIFILENNSIDGPINFVCKKPLQNQEFSEILAKCLHKKLLLSIPKFAIKLFGGMSEMFLYSQRVYPQKLIDNGFIFDYDSPESYFKKIS